MLFATPQGIQLIQRLGRVLRTDSKFPQKRACVIDFLKKMTWKKKKDLIIIDIKTQRIIRNKKISLKWQLT